MSDITSRFRDVPNTAAALYITIKYGGQLNWTRRVNINCTIACYVSDSPISRRGRASFIGRFLRLYRRAHLVGDGYVKSPSIKAALLEIDRGDFLAENEYHDLAKDIGYVATISAPHLHAFALEHLFRSLRRGAKVLDIGSGSGYLTACFALLIGETGSVIGVEHIPELVENAKISISKSHRDLLDAERVRFVVADGRIGYPTEAPFDVIHVGASSTSIPQCLIDQLKPGGRLLIPVGRDGHASVLMRIKKKQDGALDYKELGTAVFESLADRESQWPSTVASSSADVGDEGSSVADTKKPS